MTKTTTDNSAADAEPVTAEPGTTETVATVISSDDRAMALVNSYVPWSAAAGLLPLPILDMAALVGVQLRMLSKLSQMYDVPFMENGVKSIVTTLLGTVLTNGIGGSLGSLAKSIPFIGPLVGIAVVPGMYSAATYAIGRVFVSHFEAGGTFLDFDPKKTRAYFVAEFEKAKSQPDLAKSH